MSVALALTIPALLCIFGWSRLILENRAIWLLLAFVAIVFLSYYTAWLYFIVKRKAIHQQHLSSLPIIFVILCSFLTISLYYKKAELLGFDLYYIPSDSMQPTLNPGDFILTNTWFTPGDIKKNDLVTFKLDGREVTYIKRVRVLPEGKINGKTLLENQYFVIGDNLNHSQDSRFFGAIHYNNIQGIYAYTIKLNRL